MKKLVLMIAAVAIASFSFAQVKQGKGPGKGNPVKRAQKQTEWMKKELNLNADQEAKVSQVNLNAVNRLMAIPRDTTLTPDAKKGQRKVVKKMRLDQFKAILTPEQMTTFKQKMKERHEMKKGKKALPKQDPKDGGEKLGLSDSDIEDLMD
ncbi:MAG: hypothetical protein HYZ42_11220 [Bacteroidetes bacterium]|nr:hypothetical protein [Bacteroidota bacterium]